MATVLSEAARGGKQLSASSALHHHRADEAAEGCELYDAGGPLQRHAEAQLRLEGRTRWSPAANDTQAHSADADSGDLLCPYVHLFEGTTECGWGC